MKKRILSLLLSMVMALSLLPETAMAATVASGECGDNAVWTLDDEGVLTISGTGKMGYYGYASVPWYSRRSDITKIVVEDGITSIGNCAFYRCENATSISIGNTVSVIEGKAFESCKNVYSVTIPKSVTKIENAFMDMGRLREIRYAGSEAQWNKIDIDYLSYPTLFGADVRIYYAGSPSTTTLVSGNCGANAVWKLDNNGVLTISGTGAMKNYSAEGAPWFERRAEIKKVIVEKGIVSIGRSAFDKCEQITSAFIGSGVTSINYDAFSGCKNLTTLVIPKSMGTIERAFWLCDNLQDVYFEGTQTDWSRININSSSKDVLASCRMHYNSTGPVETYTVTFNGNNGTPASTVRTVTNGKTYGTLPKVTRSGYTFKGWYTARIGGTKITSTTKVNLTANQILYAQWTKNTATTNVTITLNANGGTLSTKSISVAKNATYYSKLPTPTRSGYEFDGWYTARSGGTKITSTTKATVSRTIYAQWTKAAEEKDTSCQVTFNAAGGTVFQKRKIVLQGTRYRDLPTPTRNGYQFTGWYTASSGGTKVTAATKVTKSGNHTLYARWSKNAVTVRTTKDGNWTVYVPPYCRVALYSSQTGLTQSTANAPKTSEYGVNCTKTVTLSNGTQRYYGSFGGRNYWFQFSCEMDVD